MTDPLRERTPDELRDYLAPRVGRPLTVTLTANRVRFLGFAFIDGACNLRINREFLGAADDVLQAVVEWISNPGRPCPETIRSFIRSCAPRPRGHRRIVLRPRGFCHDLEDMSKRVNEQFFQGRVNARITWGRSNRRKVRSRRLGSFQRQSNVIRVNPVLDRPEVPPAFIEYVIYHEMLHAVQDPGARPHDSQFQRALRRHPMHRWAIDWQKSHPELVGLK